MRKYAVLVAIIGVAAWAFGPYGTVKAAEGEAAPAGVAATVTGLNYCVEVELKLVSEADAEAAMDKYLHALKVEEAKDGDGNALDDLKGCTLFYLRSDEGAPLSTDKAFHNKKVTIQGTLFKDQRVIKVASVAVVEEKETAQGQGLSSLEAFFAEQVGKISVAD